MWLWKYVKKLRGLTLLEELLRIYIPIFQKYVLYRVSTSYGYGSNVTFQDGFFDKVLTHFKRIVLQTYALFQDFLSYLSCIPDSFQFMSLY